MPLPRHALVPGGNGRRGIPQQAVVVVHRMKRWRRGVLQVLWKRCGGQGVWTGMANGRRPKRTPYTVVMKLMEPWQATIHHQMMRE
jgi:hypothetical protein